MGGARGREGEDEKLQGSGEGSAAWRAREKDVFLVVPRRTNPNKHELELNSNIWKYCSIKNFCRKKKVE